MIFFFLYIILIIMILVFILKFKNNGFKSEIYSNKSTDTLYNFFIDSSDIDIIKVNLLYNYNGKNVSGMTGSPINYILKSQKTGDIYNFMRYPDFKDEIKRHSFDYLNNYLIFIQNNFINNQTNFIFDFIDYHGYLDNKVYLWNEIKNIYGRELANQVMGITYLIPNDIDLFNNNYKSGKKFILKNSFGGARSSLKITNDYKDIIKYFNRNKNLNFDPCRCKDSVCHSKVKFNIVQEFINPGLLIQNRKIGFRLYLVIFSINSQLYGLLYKDGYCNYSEDNYNENSINLNNNVLGIVKNNQALINKHKLPIFFKDFLEYARNTLNVSDKLLNYFIYKLRKNCLILINSVKNNFSFGKQDNIKKFSIFGIDVEINENFEPVIFEANFYISRFRSQSKYGKLISNLYNDIFNILGIVKEKINGFWDL